MGDYKAHRWRIAPRETSRGVKSLTPWNWTVEEDGYRAGGMVINLLDLSLRENRALGGVGGLTDPDA